MFIELTYRYQNSKIIKKLLINTEKINAIMPTIYYDYPDAVNKGSTIYLTSNKFIVEESYDEIKKLIKEN